MRDAAFEAAIEGNPGVEISECANDAGRPAVSADSEVERAEGFEAGKGVDVGVDTGVLLTMALTVTVGASGDNATEPNAVLPDFILPG